MDVHLKVLAGAKVGAKVAIRKNQFFIGRSDQCHLSVGTTSVSRKHCVLRRRENKLTVEDLGSRNGTLVNGKKISGEVELAAGDELSVGPLLFQVRISSGLSNEKQPKVKSVAEAVQRTASQPSAVDDDEISSWLLGPGESESSAQETSMHETKAMQLDETSALELKRKAKQQASADDASADDASESSVAIESPEEDSGEIPKKKGPGKLPFRPEKEQTKDSREAAANALRNWSRRR